jgi:hypothetical protein
VLTTDQIEALTAAPRAARATFVDEHKECPVCLGTLRADARGGVCQLRCGHRYHATCIKNWLVRSATCPVCRCDASSHDSARADAYHARAVNI